MDAPRVTKPSPESFRESHRRSSRWLALAVVGTVVGVVLLYGAFSNASLMPTQQPVLSPEKPALHEGNLVIAVARTPGGPTEWVNWAQVISYLSEALGQPVVVRYLTEEDEAAGVTMEANISDLREGLIDATVVNSVQVNVDTLGLRVIEASPYFGNPPIVVSTHVSEELAERVQSILLSFDARSQLPDDSAIDGFVVLDPDEYDFANVLRVACDDHVHP
jgi:hypothetical protein